MIKISSIECRFFLLAALFLSLFSINAQTNSYETDSQGKTIYIKIDPAFSIKSLSPNTNFVVTTRNDQMIPIVSASFTSNLISIKLQDRLIYDDGSTIKLSFTVGTITYSSGVEMIYFSNQPTSVHLK